jgi:hypothetical protein
MLKNIKIIHIFIEYKITFKFFINCGGKVWGHFAPARFAPHYVKIVEDQISEDYSNIIGLTTFIENLK